MERQTFGETLHGSPHIQDYLVVVLVVLPHIPAFNRTRLAIDL